MIGTKTKSLFLTWLLAFALIIGAMIGFGAKAPNGQVQAEIASKRKNKR